MKKNTLKFVLVTISFFAYIQDSFCVVPSASLVPSFAGDTVCPKMSVCFSTAASVFTDSLVLDWGDGSPKQKYTVNPNFLCHAFSAASTVKLIAYNGTLSDTATKKLTLRQIPQPNFSHDFNPSVCLKKTGVVVTFTNLTTGITPTFKYDWDFGDGYTDVVKNPVHTYYNAGKYYIRLKARPDPTSYFCDWLEYKDSITITEDNSIITNMAANPGCPCNVISFNATGSAVSWLWNFGDNTASSLQNPVHTYASPGKYNVTLEGLSGAGCYFVKKMPVTVCGGDTNSISKSNNRWYFGNPAAGIDFNSGIATALTDGAISSLEGSSTISDPNTGDLLFYTNGQNVWDKTHSLMPNGTGLNGQLSTSQTSLIVPLPGNRNKYYIITANGITSNNKGYYYSVVDMTQNFGKGDVVSKNNVFFIGPCTEAKTASAAVVHEALSGTVKYKGDCIMPAEYWVVIPACKDTFKSFLITSLGISTPITTYAPDNGYNGAGYSCISPDGSKYAITQYNSGINKIRLFDFNKYTGALSNEKKIIYLNSSGFGEVFYGLCFSPNSSILYGSTSSNYHQFDINASNISASAYKTTIVSTSFWGSYLGPDNKIYFATGGNTTLNVINNPDVLGSGCNMIINGFSLNGRISRTGLQNIVPLAPLDTIKLKADFQYTINQCLKSITPTNPSCDFMPDSIQTTWDFGDGTVLNFNTLQFPTHTYLSGGTYNVKLVMKRGCFKSDSIIKTVIINPGLILNTTFSVTNANCGSSNGSVVASTTGGTGTLVYTWSSGGSSDTENNLSQGTYTVTITDANNCSTTTTVNIGNTGGASIASITKTDAICNGGTGSAIVNITGGVSGNYTYSWSNGANTITTATSNQELLTSNSYTVTVIDGACSTTSVVNITAPPSIILGTITPTSASCGQSNGFATTAIATGGTGTLTYSWSNGNNGQTASNLSAQTYTLTVRDANNCSTTTTVNIGNTGGASISSINKTDALCNGGTGSATVNITGGASGNYTYSWSNGANTITTATSNQELLTSNTYTVTVIDGSCTVTTVFTITQPTPIIASAVQNTPASCGLNNGEAIASATGGNNSNYNYVWSNGTTTSTATGLSAGTYIITVTDANNCAQTTSVNISNSPAPTINSLTPSVINCNGGTTTATVSATGNGTLSYAWSNGNTTTTATNLTAGNYNITVTDGNGCKAIQSFSITQPSAIILSTPVITNANCNQSNGSISITASGGTGILTYSWSNGVSNGQSTVNNPTTILSNLLASIYTITITDNNSCITTTTANVNNTSGVSITNTSKNDVLCNSGSGSATVTITPSTAPYTFSWSNGATSITTNTTSQILNLISNNYTLTVTDANNCSTTTTVQINQPALLSIATPTKTDASCNQSNGSISITASGGTGLYTYSWSNGASTITTGTSNQSLLSSNTYTVTVTDNNNCSTTTSTTILNINSTINAAVTTNITSNTITEGESIVLSAGGGNSYTWTPNNSLSCATCPVTIANPTATTTYTLIVKDNLGCADTTDITINVKKPCTGEEDVFIANVFSPNNDGKNDVLQIQGNGLTNIYFAIYDRWGNLMFESRDQAQGWDGNVNGNTANAGTYVYYLKATCKKTLQEIILKGNVSVVK